MDAPSQNTDVRTAAEETLCPSCFKPIDESFHFCPHCSAPIGATSTLSPLGRIWAASFFLRKLYQRPWGKVIIWGYLASLLLPILLALISTIFSLFLGSM